MRIPAEPSPEHFCWNLLSETDPRWAMGIALDGRVVRRELPGHPVDSEDVAGTHSVGRSVAGRRKVVSEAGPDGQELGL